ncbi:hypothetical protein GCM10010515_51700 [Streptomyces fructofermentans]|uniref:Uncharacterized protein n=1 Tax=Streptomyces fructofermentans TaxID=152141 RepID=A0A918KUU3_9ACTN|nr:hypothetical protein GCM10010515_51700 [Streptomyces fructofermentans]
MVREGVEDRLARARAALVRAGGRGADQGGHGDHRGTQGRHVASGEVTRGNASDHGGNLASST